MRYRKKTAKGERKTKRPKSLRVQCEQFSPAVALSCAVETLKLAHSTRHAYAPRAGHRVAVAAIPLCLAPTLNVFAEMHPWKRKEVKTRCADLMAEQIDAHAIPASGQPTVVMLRFTSAPRNDHDMAFTKIPLDRLTDFGLIADDSTEAIRLVAKCVKCKPGRGFVYVEVWHE